MADITLTRGDSDAALRQAAAEERRLLERERRAEQRVAEARAKLARAEQKLARIQARVTRRTQEVAKAEARLRQRQQARAAGPALDGTASPAATRLTPTDTVSVVNAAAHSPDLASVEGMPIEAPVISVTGDGPKPDEVTASPRRSHTRRPTTPKS